jgi:hypothetical protein
MRLRATVAGMIMRRLALAGAALAALTAVVAFPLWRIPWSPSDAIRRFHANNGPEDTLMDPLILRGRDVVPLLLLAVRDRSMPRRTYAILALGHMASSDAIGVLRDLALDSSEDGMTRCVALDALSLVDRAEATAVAARLDSASPSCAPWTDPASRRTYADALRRWHR